LNKKEEKVVTEESGERNFGLFEKVGRTAHLLVEFEPGRKELWAQIVICH